MKKYIFLVLLSFCFVKAQAQDPNWSVNAADYQYSMTFTTFLNINGTTLSSTEDKVAAFVNGEIRGVANIVYVSSFNKYVAFLSVYANTNGETISFKIFNSTSENTVEVTKTENFVIDGNVGGVFQSYSIASPSLSNQAILNAFSFSGIASVSQTISSNKVNIVLPSTTALTNLSAEYNISDGANFFVDNLKQVSGTSTNDFTNTIKYKLLSENEAVLFEYVVHVTLESANTDVPELVLKSEANAIVNQAPVIINMETNVTISGFTSEDFLLTNAIVSSITKIDDFKYSIQVVPIQQGVFSVEIPENVLLNNENEGNLASNKLTFVYDLVNPYILSIKRKNPADEITTADTLEFTITFNEAIENIFSTDLESVLDATFSIAKETDATYIVTINTIADFVGAVSLNIKSTNLIRDKAGNLLMNSIINVNQN
jgi:hypothetical protein